VIPFDCDYQDRVVQDVAILAERAFAEDMPDGDVTARVLQLDQREAEAEIICREPVSMCGGLWLEAVLEAHNATHSHQPVRVKTLHQDGARVAAGSTLFQIEGNAAALLTLERTLLNFLGRGIGIANATYAYVSQVRKHNNFTHVLDTRKTLPGYRHFDKYAVLCGGGHNHRMNLSDQILIKENHIAKLEGITSAMAFIKKHLDRQVGIQIEVRSMEELKEAIAAGFPIIMLDNFTPDQVWEACDLERGTCQLEVSGGISLTNIGTYCHPNLDRISIGAITHSIVAPDLSLLMREARI